MSSTIGIWGSFIVWYFCKCWFKRFSAYDLLANDGVDFNVKLRNVIFSSTNKDNIAVNEQVELFSGGFKLEDKNVIRMCHLVCISEFDFGYMPKDLAILAIRRQ
jgi:hypothetical protein